MTQNGRSSWLRSGCVLSSPFSDPAAVSEDSSLNRGIEKGLKPYIETIHPGTDDARIVSSHSLCLSSKSSSLVLRDCLGIVNFFKCNVSHESNCSHINRYCICHGEFCDWCEMMKRGEFERSLMLSHTHGGFALILPPFKS